MNNQLTTTKLATLKMMFQFGHQQATSSCFQQNSNQQFFYQPRTHKIFFHAVCDLSISTLTIHLLAPVVRQKHHQ